MKQWLPEMIECGRLSDEYRAEVRKKFDEDWKGTSVNFNDKPVVVYDFDKIFEHLTTQEYGSNSRDFDVQRANRIKWVRAVIERGDSKDIVRIKEKRERTVLFIEDERYVVVLQDEGKFWLLITAYYVGRQEQFIKLQRKAARAHIKR